ncbi:MAG: hypothetical protein V3T70_11650, partial [Phycisphaerae bacterium]
RSRPAALKDPLSIYAFFRKLWKSMHERYAYVNDQPHDEKSPFADLDASFLLANRHGLFGVSSNMEVTQYRHYHAIGCACDYAYGALHSLYDRPLKAGAVARGAVAAAIHFDVNCGGAIELMTLKSGRAARSRKR